MSTTFESLPTEKIITTSSRYTIRQVETEEEREAVYRFRYKVYIEEMGRTQKYADHTNRRICEPLDDKGIIIAAFDLDNNVIGTVRANFSEEEDLGDYIEWYGIKEYAKNYFPQSTAITTKLIVNTEYRNSTLAIRLAIEIYKQGFHRTNFNFIDCNPPLEKFFIGLGYIQHYRSFIHPEYGNVLPLVLHVKDLNHLKLVKSPFAKYCEELLALHPKEN